MPLTFQKVVDSLSEPSADFNALADCWEATQAAFPGEENLDFLKRPAIENSLTLVGAEPHHALPLFEMAEQIPDNPVLVRLAWHAHQRLTVHSLSMPVSFQKWPTLRPLLQERAGHFYGLISLSAVPLLRRVHQSLGVDEHITRQTARVFTAVIEAYRRYAPPEVDGTPLRYLDWLKYYLTGRLFRLGRLEWMIAPFAGKIHVYQHRVNGAVLALSEGGQRVDSEVFLCPETSQESSTAECWLTHFEIRRQEIVGHAITSNGHVSKDLIRLSAGEWRHRLSRGMEVIDMHVPNGGALTPEACRESFLHAVEFFARQSPHCRPVALACQSWIFAPCLREILPPESNLVRLSKSVHLYPMPAPANSGLYFVFGMDNRIPKTLGQNASSLQTAIFNHANRGGAFHQGGMFLLREELANLRFD